MMFEVIFFYFTTKMTFDCNIFCFSLVSRFAQGVLFRVHWERIVLDEAHIIRNHTTATSKSVCELRGDIRWVLTGTPIQNKIGDVYALLKFLRVSPFDDLATYKMWIDAKSSEGLKRLHNILKPMLLRRTKVELQEKKAMDALPQKTAQVIEIELTKNEADAYMLFLSSAQTFFLNWIKQQEAKKQGLDLNSMPEISPELRAKLNKISNLPRSTQVTQSQLLVLLLRMRLLCDHPCLIQMVRIITYKSHFLVFSIFSNLFLE